MAIADLKGLAFEEWLDSPEHAKLPDFLDLWPNSCWDLQRGDIHALRALAAGKPGERVSTPLLAGMVRLHKAEIIGRIATTAGAVYHMTPYSYEVLMHNVSYRGLPQ